MHKNQFKWWHTWSCWWCKGIHCISCNSYVQKPYFSSSCKVFCYHLCYGFICLSVLRLLWWNGLITFNWQSLAWRMNWRTSVNAKSLSPIKVSRGPRMHITLLINASAITCTVLDLIGITKIKLVIFENSNQMIFEVIKFFWHIFYI